MKPLDDNILTTLRDYFLLAAADLALYPEGSPVYITQTALIRSG